MSASTSTASTKQQRTVGRDQRRHLAAEKKRLAARQRVEQQDARDEAVAPRAQRLPVLGRDRASGSGSGLSARFRQKWKRGREIHASKALGVWLVWWCPAHHYRLLYTRNI